MTSGYLRASDRDRDLVADVLHAAYAEGKLDHEEHTERTTTALNARTVDELAWRLLGQARRRARSGHARRGRQRHQHPRRDLDPWP